MQAKVEQFLSQLVQRLIPLSQRFMRLVQVGYIYFQRFITWLSSIDLPKIPLSPFWGSLAAFPRDSLLVATAPFHFESYNWDAPRWERLSGQRVVPGFLTGFCVLQRFGEVPLDPAFRFRNGVHLADRATLAARGIDYVVWQKPFGHPIHGRQDVVGVATAHCEATLREALGPPAYEDNALIAYRL